MYNRLHTPMGVISLCLRYQSVILAVCLGHSMSDVDTDTLSEKGLAAHLDSLDLMNQHRFYILKYRKMQRVK